MKNARAEPEYRKLYDSGRLAEVSAQLEEMGNSCTLCPHRCGVNRGRGETGRCRSSLEPVVSSWNAHFGEEPVLVGTGGSGTIFFTICNMRCVFCQNFEISQLGYGEEISCRRLAEIMISLQIRGCHNVNFVTPTHMTPAIVKALLIAVPMGLRLPLVYNSGGYDSVSILRILEGVFDIYMPDFKYAEEGQARRLSGIEEYPRIAAAALREMHSQVGDLIADERGIAVRGLMVRHLVLPDDAAGSREVVDFLRGLSADTYLNIMDQYRPLYRAHEHPGLGRMVTRNEVGEVVSHARRSGMRRVVS
jgi:putative pyruvate formate lyase activating enzyme